MPHVRFRHVAVALLVSLAAAACQEGDDEVPSGDVQPEETASPESGVSMTDDSLQVEEFVGGLDQPTSVAFLDGDMLVSEKASGRVHRVRDGEVAGDVLDLAVNYFDERGLLGMVVHPDFPAEPFVYVHWTWRGDGDGDEGLLGEDTDEATEVPGLGNRIDRFRWEDEQLAFDRNIVEFPSNTLETDTSGNVRGNHDAGPLVFGDDGMLYTMMGDQNLRGQLQNIGDGPPPDDEHLAGVILRLNDDGTIPTDNPFFAAGEDIGGAAGENVQMIYAYGIRNSFGLAVEPGSGAIWQTENGDDSYDEVNVFDAGANSGWIQIQGPPEHLGSYKELEVASEDGLDVESFPPSNLADDADAARRAMFELPGSQYTAPVLSYVYPPALTAIGFVADDSLGASSQRTAWMGTVLTDSLLRYPLADDGRSLALEGDLADGVDDNESKGDLGESEDFVVGTGFGVVTDIKQGSDGALYIVSLDGGAVYRISAAGAE